MLKAEETNDFLVNSGRAQREGQPYLNHSMVEEVILKPGDKFYIVENANGGNPTPGGFGTKDKITTVRELRENLAVLEDWKNGELVVREYIVIKPLRARSGTIGPQLETSVKSVNKGNIYKGGAHQYEFIDYLGGDNWKNFVHCLDENGKILK